MSSDRPGWGPDRRIRQVPCITSWHGVWRSPGALFADPSWNGRSELLIPCTLPGRQRQGALDTSPATHGCFADNMATVRDTPTWPHAFAPPSLGSVAVFRQPGLQRRMCASDCHHNASPLLVGGVAPLRLPGIARAFQRHTRTLPRTHARQQYLVFSREARCLRSRRTMHVAVSTWSSIKRVQCPEDGPGASGLVRSSRPPG
ncbi:hypothetical protein EJ02DRAFT_113174 [Clathrospora elynae]|uniref:Uncharacterized protein n=1 Tax=Clathrospora elynae TaxID=706981 RepID=A0A6A5S8K7_9PLEO|nr:hypothetical protein EJ02DRAFT_113174 [Clathrospora elynae]